MPRRPLAVIARSYAPHLLIAPPFLGWRYASDAADTEAALPWLHEALGWATVAAVAAAWVASSVVVGRRLIPRLPAVRWAGIKGWWRWMHQPYREAPGDDALSCLMVVAGLAAVTLLAAAGTQITQLWASPVWCAAAIQAADMGLLTAALFRTSTLELVRQRAETERSRSDRESAVRSVQSYFEEHAALISEEFPAVRLLMELRVRIPGSASPDDAWSAARSLLQELHEIVSKARRERARELGRAVPGSPARDRAVDLRVLIGQLDAQITQAEEEVSASRGRGENPAWIERQLADLRRRRREAAAEIETLIPLTGPATAVGV